MRNLYNAGGMPVIIKNIKVINVQSEVPPSDSFYNDFLSLMKRLNKEICETYNIKEFFFFNPEEACDFIVIVECVINERTVIFGYSTDDFVTETDIRVRISMI